MITMTDNGLVRETCFLNPKFDNGNGNIEFECTKDTWVKSGEEWVKIEDACKERWKIIFLSNDKDKVDPATGLLYVLQFGQIEYPETVVGAYDYICGVDSATLPLIDPKAFRAIAYLMETFVVANGYIPSVGS